MRTRKLLFFVFMGLASLLVQGCSDSDENEGDKNGDTLISSFAFENQSIVAQQPVMQENGTDIYFYVSPEATAVDLKSLTPTIQLAAGATVVPASGVAQDFSNGSVVYTVTAEDGITKVEYNISYFKCQLHDFEEWQSTGAGKANREDVVGWASSNLGIATLKALGMYTGDWTHYPSDEAKSGKRAAVMQTIKTEGDRIQGFGAPLITSGSLYTGTFKLDAKQPLNSTKFGVVFEGQPIRLKGWFMYTPGPDFYFVKEKGTNMKTTKWEIDPARKDEYSIMAVLYEIETDEETLTGLTIANSEKIIARAHQTGGVQEAWTAFDLKMELLPGKSYDSEKKYKFAIVCSSSKNGDAYEGAPESALALDDVEVLYR